MAQQMFTGKFVPVKFNDIPAYTLTMKVEEILFIHYIAVRGVDDEEGSVQRPLSSRRISSIKQYILEGNMFFNSFILNWTKDTDLVNITREEISFPLISSAAQVIDGQHRLAGLEEAVKQDPDIAQKSLIVTLCIGLSTRQAAQVFLNINTEQRPVPKSLIFDLFGEVINDPVHAINRATDIARALNDYTKSPLHNLIKFPGENKTVGKIELSTFVSSIKHHFEKDGVFSKTNLKSLELQSKVLSNFFEVLKDYYTEERLWISSSNNPFLKAAGFNGAIDYLCDVLITECAKSASFETSKMKSILSLERGSPLTWEDLKGQDGKTARKNVKLYLERGMLKSIGSHASYKF